MDLEGVSRDARDEILSPKPIRIEITPISNPFSFPVDIETDLVLGAENDNFRVVYAAIKLLAAMGEEGQQILKEIYYGTTNHKTKAMIKERLRM